MSLRRPLVLFVDDHADTRELYQLALAYEGFAVVVAETVERAIQCVTDQLPDVIVTDLSLAATDGYGFLHWLHGIGGVGIPVIALTGWAVGGGHPCSDGGVSDRLPQTVSPRRPRGADPRRAGGAARGVGT